MVGLSAAAPAPAPAAAAAAPSPPPPPPPLWRGRGASPSGTARTAGDLRGLVGRSGSLPRTHHASSGRGAGAPVSARTWLRFSTCSASISSSSSRLTVRSLGSRRRGPRKLVRLVEFRGGMGRAQRVQVGFPTAARLYEVLHHTRYRVRLREERKRKKERKENAQKC